MRNIGRYTRYLPIALLILLVSCQSNVRFSSHIDRTKQVENRKWLDISSLNLNDKQKIILNESEALVGTPYCYGGIGMNCFDCSGFVQLIYNKIGIKLPRSAEEQYSYSNPIDKDEVQLGDLVFFKTGRKISHVGIYIGNNSFIHSSSSLGVTWQSLEESYYKQHFASFGRVLK